MDRSIKDMSYAPSTHHPSIFVAPLQIINKRHYEGEMTNVGALFREYLKKDILLYRLQKIMKFLNAFSAQNPFNILRRVYGTDARYICRGS